MLAILILILDSETAVNGVSEGISICIKSVVPCLFPFIFLSNILVSSLYDHSLSPKKESCSKQHISSIRIVLLLTGYLGGYPVGAQSVAQAYRNHQLSQSEAQRLLICCNNPGPAFIFGIVGAVFFQSWVPWVLWSIHLLSSMMMLFLLPSESMRIVDAPNRTNCDITFTLMHTLRSMTYICGWVILFRCMINILQRWCLWLLPEVWKIIIYGLLELTNGCLSLQEINCVGLRFALGALMLSFGGGCAFVQTCSVTEGLPCCGYFRSKILQGGFSLMLAYFLQHFLFSENDRFHFPTRYLVAAIGTMLFLAWSLRKNIKSSRNLSAVGV